MELLRSIPVDYDDAEHKYSARGERYLSSTQIIEKFCNHFDPIVESEKYAAKHGGTPEYWREQWRLENEKACLRGDTIHEAEETILHGRMIDRFNGLTVPVQGDIVSDELPWFSRPDGVYPERKLWHHGYKIAGRADKITLLTDPTDRSKRYAYIDDNKTNKRLQKVSYQFKNSGNYKMMLPPLGHIMDCNWWHYQLQLSLYMFMLEYQGFIPGGMTITYFPHPTPEDPNPTKQKHDVTYMKREVISMLTFLRRKP